MLSDLESRACAGAARAHITGCGALCNEPTSPTPLRATPGMCSATAASNGGSRRIPRAPCAAPCAAHRYHPSRQRACLGRTAASANSLCHRLASWSHEHVRRPSRWRHSSLPWPGWGELSRLLAAPRTQDALASRSAPNGRLRCGCEAWLLMSCFEHPGRLGRAGARFPPSGLTARPRQPQPAQPARQHGPNSGPKSQGPGSARARRLRLFGAHLAALGGSALPGEGAGHRPPQPCLGGSRWQGVRL